MQSQASSSETNQLLVALPYVRSRLLEAHEQAHKKLGLYAETGTAEALANFLQDIQKIRMVFQSMNFRAGERMCDEVADTARLIRHQPLSAEVIDAFMMAVTFIRRYVEIAARNEVVDPSLLVPVINQVRACRAEQPLPESFFFKVNLRPNIKYPQVRELTTSLPYSKILSLYQLGLQKLVENQDRSALVKMQQSIGVLEKASRGRLAWLFWFVLHGALETLKQPAFQITDLRRQALQQIEDILKESAAGNIDLRTHKIPDGLLKELLFWIAKAEPSTDALKTLHKIFMLETHLRESQIVQANNRLYGPDEATFESLVKELLAELTQVKEQLDAFARTQVSEEPLQLMLESLARTAEIYDLIQYPDYAKRIRRLRRFLQRYKAVEVEAHLAFAADEITQVEQFTLSLRHNFLDRTALVDSVVLKEAHIEVIGECLILLGEAKRKLHYFAENLADITDVQAVIVQLQTISIVMDMLEYQVISKPIHDLIDFIEGHLTADNGAQLAQVELSEQLVGVLKNLEQYFGTLYTPSEQTLTQLRIVADSIQALRE